MGTEHGAAHDQLAEVDGKDLFRYVLNINDFLPFQDHNFLESALLAGF